MNTLHPTDQPPAAAPALFAVYTGPRLLGQYRAATARSAIAAARRVHERLGVSFAKGAHVWADCVAAGQKRRGGRMSYSTNPVIDAARYWEPRYAAADRQAQAEASMADDLLRACRQGDANALAPWAPQVTDYTGTPYAVGSARPRRLQTLAECMTDALDYLDAHTELHQLLLNAAAGADVRAQATALLARLADGFASQYADGGE